MMCYYNGHHTGYNDSDKMGVHPGVDMTVLVSNVPPGYWAVQTVVKTWLLEGQFTCCYVVMSMQPVWTFHSLWPHYGHRQPVMHQHGMT